MMSTLLSLLVVFGANAYLSFNRMSLKHFAVLNIGLFLLFLIIFRVSFLAGLITFVLAAIGIFLNMTGLRKQILSRPAFSMFKKILPAMSTTEKEALDAGTTWWEETYSLENQIGINFQAIQNQPYLKKSRHLLTAQ